MNTNPVGYTYSDYLTHKDDELYHFGIKGMKWGVRKDRGTSGYNRRKDVMKRLFTNDHIGAIKTGIKSRREYKRKLKANMEYDDMYNKLLDDKINANPKMKKAKAAERDMSRIRRKQKEKERIANDPELRRRRRNKKIKIAIAAGLYGYYRHLQNEGKV